MNRLTLAGALAALAACGSDFDPSSRVTGYRLLATRADLPYARPGERVQLEALAVDGAGRPFQVAWASCLRPSSTSALGCLDALDASQPLVQGPAMVRHTVDVPADILDGVSAEATGLITVGAVQVVCPGAVQLAPGDDQLPVRCADEAGDRMPLDSFDVGVKRIFVRERDRNANPAIAEVWFDGAPWPADEVKQVAACDDPDENRFDRCDGPSYTLAVTLGDGAVEEGVDELGAPFREALLAQYYATEGLFEYEVKDALAPETRYKARPGAAGKIITMWFVVRDDRGGVTWTERRLEIR